MHRCLNCGQSGESNAAATGCEHCGWSPPNTRTLHQILFDAADKTTQDDVAPKTTEQETEKLPKATPHQKLRATKSAIVIGLITFAIFLTPATFLAVAARDWIPLIFFGSGAAVFGTFIGVRGYFAVLKALRQFPDSEDAFFEASVRPLLTFTEYVNGDLTRRPDSTIPFVGKVPGHLESIQFECHEAKSRLVWVRGTKKQKSYLYLLIALPKPTSFRGTIRAKHIGTDVASKLGVIQDRRVGNRSFDDHFVVTCDDSAPLKQIISKPVQDAMLRLKLWVSNRNFSEKRVELSIRENEVVFKLGQYLRETDDFIKFYEESKCAFLELRKRLDSLPDPSSTS